MPTSHERELEPDRDTRRPASTQASVVAWLEQIDAEGEEAAAAAVKLARLCSQKADTDAAEVEWSYRAAIDSGDTEWVPIAALELGEFRYRIGDGAGAQIALQTAIDSGDPSTAAVATQLLQNITPSSRLVGGETVYVLPDDWPGGNSDAAVLFRGYYPRGVGDGEAVLSPWSGEGAPPRTQTRGWQPHGGDPIRNSPLTDDSGGVVYFRAHAGEQDMKAMFDVLGINSGEHDYAVIWESSESPQETAYVASLRVLTHRALERIDRSAVAGLPRQPMTVETLLLRFVSEQLQNWDTRVVSHQMKVDGDSTKALPSFGLLVENSRLGVYRVWSRPWLASK